MRGFLSVLLFVMVPSWLFAQGGVTTTDDYDAGARSPELFQPGEEAEALLLMPLQAYPSAFSSLSDFNFHSCVTTVGDTIPVTVCWPWTVLRWTIR